MNRIILLAFMLLSSFGLLNCGNDCPEVNQPEVQELSKWQKQRFPYLKYYKLVFRIDEPGRIDTITLYREYIDSSTVNTGDNVNTDDNCPQAWNGRYEHYKVSYNDSRYVDNLKFITNSHTNCIVAKWNEDSTYISHNIIDKLFGSENEKRNRDTILVLDSIFTNAFRGKIDYSPKTNTQYVYSYPECFVFIHDKLNNKKWYLLDAE